MDHPPAAPPEAKLLHASCVALEGQAVLIRGASGQGKSALALQLLAMGAGLVADDRTSIWVRNDNLWADAPDRLRGKIEAREVGLLTTPAVGPAPVKLLVDLDQSETARLPAHYSEMIEGVQVTLLKKSALPHFPAAIALYLKGSRFA